VNLHEERDQLVEVEIPGERITLTDQSPEELERLLQDWLKESREK
jgi:hypothetical protein